jgi:hypothetical protein
MIYSSKYCSKNPSPATRQGGKNEVSVKANASFTGVTPKLKHPVSVQANVGFIDVKRSGRN